VCQRGEMMHCGISTGTVSQKVEGEGRLTPRQDPQGEESRQEEQQQRQQQCTYQKM